MNESSITQEELQQLTQFHWGLMRWLMGPPNEAGRDWLIAHHKPLEELLTREELQPESVLRHLAPRSRRVILFYETMQSVHQDSQDTGADLFAKALTQFEEHRGDRAGATSYGWHRRVEKTHVAEEIQRELARNERGRQEKNDPLISAYYKKCYTIYGKMSDAIAACPSFADVLDENFGDSNARAVKKSLCHVAALRAFQQQGAPKLKTRFETWLRKTEKISQPDMTQTISEGLDRVNAALTTFARAKGRSIGDVMAIDREMRQALGQARSVNATAFSGHVERLAAESINPNSQSL